MVHSLPLGIDFARAFIYYLVTYLYVAITYLSAIPPIVYVPTYSYMYIPSKVSRIETYGCIQVCGLMPGKQVMGQLLWHHYTSSPKLRQRKFGLCLSSRHTLVASLSCRYTLHTSKLWLDEWIGLCVMAHTIASYIEHIRYRQNFFGSSWAWNHICI